MEWPVRKEMGRLVIKIRRRRVIKIRRRGKILFLMCVCLKPKMLYWFRKFDVCVLETQNFILAGSLVSWNLGFTDCNTRLRYSLCWRPGREKSRSDQAEISLHKLIKNILKFCFLSVKMETLHFLDNHLTSFIYYHISLILRVWACFVDL